MKSKKQVALTEDQKKEIELLMSQVTCDKGFRCVRHKFNALCKTKKVHGEDYLICLEGSGKDCRYFNKVDGKGICGCPLRKIAARIVSGSD